MYLKDLVEASTGNMCCQLAVGTSTTQQTQLGSCTVQTQRQTIHFGKYLEFVCSVQVFSDCQCCSLLYKQTTKLSLYFALNQIKSNRYTLVLLSIAAFKLKYILSCVLEVHWFDPATRQCKILSQIAIKTRTSSQFHRSFIDVKLKM